jgi:hypothetical protein
MQTVERVDNKEQTCGFINNTNMWCFDKISRLVSVMEVAASISLDSAKGLEGWGQGHLLGLRPCDERPQVSRQTLQSVGN